MSMFVENGAAAAIRQMPLALGWPKYQCFASFEAGENASVVAGVKQLASEEAAPWMVVGGEKATGKTHLLMAACQLAGKSGVQVQYLPLKQLAGKADRAIRGCAGAPLLVLDDVHTIVGDKLAEHALFDVYNRAHDDGDRLLLSCRGNCSHLSFDLPDLTSRIHACTRTLLKPLDEQTQREILRSRARDRGIALDDAVLNWLFVRHTRDLETLIGLLEKIDETSLAAGRRVTIPFLRQYLDGH